MGQAAGFSRLPADDLRRQDSMAGALAKATHIRRIWRGRELKIATSGVAKAQPKAVRCSELGNVPGRQLTAHELIQMAQAARRSQPGLVANFVRFTAPSAYRVSFLPPMQEGYTN